MAGDDATLLAFQQVGEGVKALDRKVDAQAVQTRTHITGMYKKIDRLSEHGTQHGQLMSKDVADNKEDISDLKVQIRGLPTPEIPALGEGAAPQNGRAAFWNMVGKGGPIAIIVVGCVAVVTFGVVYAYLKTRGV